VADQWYSLHAQVVHGPLSGDKFRCLAQAGGLDSLDLDVLVGWEPRSGIPAEGALKLPAPAQPTEAWTADLVAAIRFLDLGTRGSHDAH
jgi:hypothetical protein